MPRPLVKICGLTTLEDARFCAGFGADYLGFVQHEDSPRYVPPATVREILSWVYGAQGVGVFVNRTAEEVNAACEAAGFALAQLHGTESPETVAAVRVPVVKAIRVAHDASAEQLDAAMAPYEGLVTAFLLDTHATSLWGGTGESFNWRVARDLSTQKPVWLAGGLTPENVVRAVETMRPAAVDVSSGLESAPGVKDFDRVAAFFDALAVFDDAS